MRTALLTSTILAAAMLAQTATAQTAEAGREVEEVTITAARTVLPANALPLTVDVIDPASLQQQVTIAGSVVDAVAAVA